MPIVDSQTLQKRKSTKKAGPSCPLRYRFRHEVGPGCQQTDFSSNDFFYWAAPWLPLRDMEVIKELRALEKCMQERLAELEKEVVSNKDLMIQEEAILEATQKEIIRLERQSFYSQFGPV